MRWSILIGVLISFFVLEGTLVQVISLNASGGSFHILPRFVLVLLIYISLFIGRRRAFILGLLFGLFIDIQYSDVIGVYAFSLAIIPYVSALAYQYFQLNIVLIILTVLLSVYAHETMNYYLFELFGLAGGSFEWRQHIPTAIFNAVFALLIYRPVYYFLERMMDGRQDEEHL